MSSLLLISCQAAVRAGIALPRRLTKKSVSNGNWLVTGKEPRTVRYGTPAVGTLIAVGCAAIVTAKHFSRRNDATLLTS